MRRGGVREGVWIGCFFPGHPLLRKHHAKECSSSLYLLGHSWVRDGNFTVEGLGTYLAYRKVGFELEFLGFLKWACTFCHTLLPTSSHASAGTLPEACGGDRLIKVALGTLDMLAPAALRDYAMKI